MNVKKNYSLLSWIFGQWAGTYGNRSMRV